MTMLAEEPDMPDFSPTNMAWRIQRAREDLRVLWGAAYEQRILPCRVLVRTAARRLRCPVLEAPFKLAREAAGRGERLEGFTIGMLLAASVEESETPHAEAR